MIFTIKKHPDYEQIYKDSRFKLYKVKTPSSRKARPCIYISGNVEESYYTDPTKKNFGKGNNILIKNEAFFCHSNDCYDPMVHSPYVGIITYEGKARPCHAIDFASSLLKSMQETDLTDSDIIAKSYGSLIALKALERCNYSDLKELINHVYAFNPPIYGSPLADEKQLKENLFKWGYLRYLLVIAMSLKTIDPKCGSTKENAFGIGAGEEFDPSKFTVIGGSINKLHSLGISHIMMKLTSNYIKKAAGEKNGEEGFGTLNDGVVFYDEIRMLKDGTDFIGLGEVDHSDLGNADYMKKGYEAILAHKQLEKSIF